MMFTRMKMEPQDAMSWFDLAWASESLGFGPDLAELDEEMLDSQNFLACDGGSPDLNARMATFNTNAFIDNAAKKVVYQSDMDQDDARSTADMQEIQCLTVAWTISQKGSHDANGDGTADSVAHGVRLLSISPTTFSDWNMTSKPTVYKDGDAGWSVAAYSSGAEWYSLFDATGKFASEMPSSGPWVMTDTHVGGGAAADTGVVAILLNQPDGSPAGYQIPSQVGVICFTYKLEIGSPGAKGNYIVTGEWYLLTRA